MLDCSRSWEGFRRSSGLQGGCRRDTQLEKLAPLKIRPNAMGGQAERRTRGRLREEESWRYNADVNDFSEQQPIRDI